MRAKVSVIIPVYNVEPHIERCARSLFEQTLYEIEYIFVNDCTPDRSMLILQSVLENYPHRQKQVTIINQPCNLGAAKAREDGIKAATGEYIIHCDSDDWIAPEMYQLMYEKAVTERLDMVICDWYETDGICHSPICQNFDKHSDLLRGLVNRSISGSLCNRLTAHHIYRKITDFPTAHMMEDVAYSIQLTVNCQGNIGYLSKPLYYYYHNNQSVCHQPGDASCLARCQQACNNIDHIIKFLESNNLADKYRHELVALKNSARVFIWPLYMQEPRRYRKIWRSIYPEINHIYPFTPGIDRSLRLIFFLAVIGIYPYILRFVHKLK